MKKEESGLYTIGEMSKLCSLPPRQLRYYDQLGIIRPNYRSSETGYRYYTEDQIEQFLFLKSMRDIGISNESIQRLFINRDVDQLVQELQINLMQVEQEIQEAFSRYRRIINALVTNTKTLAYLHGDEAIRSTLYSEFWISIVKLPCKRILSTQYQDNFHSCNRKEYVRRVSELNQIAAENQIALDGTRITIFHSIAIEQLCSDDFQNDTFAYEIAQEIKSGYGTPTTELSRDFGGFNALSTVNVGPQSTLRNAYRTLRKWAEDHQVELADVAVEEYLADSFVTSDSNRFVTKIYIPIKNEYRDKYE